MDLTLFVVILGLTATPLFAIVLIWCVSPSVRPSGQEQPSVTAEPIEFVAAPSPPDLPTNESRPTPVVIEQAAGVSYGGTQSLDRLLD